MAKKKSLGKGLEALLTKKNEAFESEVVDLSVDMIKPNPFQPRRQFDEESLAELADSIKEHGLLQPIVVNKSSEGYEIVVGERRYRASRLIGLEKIPAIIKNFNQKEQAVLALIENLQREGLNAVDEAEGYKQLKTEFSLNQSEVAKSVGKSRSYVANSMRLLNLDSKILELLKENTITVGHARALLSFDEDLRISIANEIVQKGLTVRDVENYKIGSNRRPNQKKDVHIKNFEKLLTEKIGSRVKISQKNKDFTVKISFHSKSDLEEFEKRIK
ncbi:MAG: hypothetical protein CSB16_00290 [Clostridiales bacterium]|nr:MAG: hypothetical protein CSB16_00290 [Clostridiales bacterium]